MPTTARQPFGERSSAWTRKLPAALFTSVVTGPSASSAASKAAATASGSRTSHGAANPSPSSSATVSSSGSRRRPTTATFAPREPSSSAMARPRPVPPPVISATRPASGRSAGTEFSRRAYGPDQFAVRPFHACRYAPEVGVPEHRVNADSQERSVRGRSGVGTVIPTSAEDGKSAVIDVDTFRDVEVRVAYRDESRYSDIVYHD